MSPSLHLWLGLAVLTSSLAVGLWGLLLGRQRHPVGWPLVLIWSLSLLLLSGQLLLGMVLWLEGDRVPSLPTLPQLQRLAVYAHAGAPLVALIVALGLISGDGVRRTAGRYAAGALVVAGVTIANFALLRITGA